MISKVKKLLLVPGLVLFATLLNQCKTVNSSKDDSLLSAAASKEISTRVVSSEEHFKTYSVPGSGLIPGSATLKFLSVGKSGKAPFPTYYMNHNSECPRANPDCNKYHFNFGHHLFGKQFGFDLNGSTDDFNKVTYFIDQGKHFVAGALNRYEVRGEGIIYGIQLFPQDLASEKTIVDIAESVQKSFLIPGAKLKFVSTGNQQKVTDPAQLARLKSLGIGLASLDSILGDLPFIPMNKGVAFGHLRMFPKNQDELLPTDIVVFDELPLDLSVVAGVITKAFQDSSSHINLKSKERKTPNLVLRDAGPQSVSLKDLIDKPVRLEVKENTWSIELSTDAKVREVYESRRPPNHAGGQKMWESTLELLSYNEMCPNAPADCLKRAQNYGGKGANLGFLTEVLKDGRVFLPNSKETVTFPEYSLVPSGFAIPIQYYTELVNYPSNAKLKEELSAFLKDVDLGRLRPAEINLRAAAIRQMILSAEIPPALYAAVKEKMDKVAPKVMEWKIRSSASAEDIEGFDGAGLHDSYAGKIDKKDKADHKCVLEENPPNEPGELMKMKVSPKTIGCAMKGVYASLWNKRAIDERSFAFMKQELVGMGLAVVPTYDNEGFIAANSVMVTRIVNSDIMGISLSIQDKNNTVTNPTPGTWSELTMAVSAGPKEQVSYTTVRFAKPFADEPARTSTVMNERNSMIMTELARKVEEAYCRAKPAYFYNEYRKRFGGRVGPIEDVCEWVSYDSEKTKSLDFETKVLCEGPHCPTDPQVGDAGVRIVVKQVREFAGQ